LEYSCKSVKYKSEARTEGGKKLPVFAIDFESNPIGDREEVSKLGNIFRSENGFSSIWLNSTSSNPVYAEQLNVRSVHGSDGDYSQIMEIGTI